jgi:hypothetical protein
MILCVKDRHRLRPKAFRPDPDEYDDAMKVLKAENREMDAFVRACLRLLRDKPGDLLALLAPYWPPPKPRGRPTKEPPEQQED